MSHHPIVADAERKMQKATEVLSEGLRGIRTGRASPALVEGVRVEYYGAPTPLKQLAAITTPEPQLIVVKPFDPSVLGEIQKSILKADVGLTPQSDGKVVRLPVPPLSEERRKQLATQVKKAGEEAKVSVRNVRRDSKKAIEDAEKAKQMSEDDKFKNTEDLQKMTERFEKLVDETVAKKTKEVMEV
jgi:ribosome recycling factor